MMINTLKKIQFSSAFLIHEKLNFMVASCLIVSITFFCYLLTGLTIIKYSQDIINNLAQHGFTKASIVATTISIGYFFLVYSFAKIKKEINPKLFISILIPTLICLHIAYYNLAYGLWVSDFQSMWDSANKLVEQKRIFPNNIIEQRALPILVPAIYFFGNNPIIVPIINSIILIAITLLGHDTIKKIHGHFYAQLFCLIFISCAEPLFSIKIPDHDLWGLFFIALALWLIVKFKHDKKNTARTITFGLVCGIFIIATSFQRELGALFIVAWLACIFIEKFNNPENSNKKYKFGIELLFIATSIIVFSAGIQALKISKVTEYPSYKHLASIRTASLSPGFSDGSFTYGHYNFGKAIFNQLSLEEKEETAKSILLSDFIDQPYLRIPSILYKASLIAPLGSQSHFYQNGMEHKSPDLLELLTQYNKIISIIICIFLIKKTAPTLISDKNFPALFGITFLGIMIAGLLTIGEAQPRYIFPIWFFAAIIIASPTDNIITSPSTKKITLLGSLFLSIFFIIAWTFAKIAYHESAGKIISSFDISIDGKLQKDTLPPTQLDINSMNGRTLGIGKLGITFSGDTPTNSPIAITAKKYLCIKDKRSLKFSYVMPYTNKNVQNYFQISLKFKNKILWTTSLPNDGTFKNIEINDIAPSNSCGELEFEYTSTHQLFNTSWVNASRLEIYFPRLSAY